MKDVCISTSRYLTEYVGLPVIESVVVSDANCLMREIILSKRNGSPTKKMNGYITALFRIILTEKELESSEKNMLMEWISAIQTEIGVSYSAKFNERAGDVYICATKGEE